MPINSLLHGIHCHCVVRLADYDFTEGKTNGDFSSYFAPCERS